METTLRCQSCGMPIGPGFFGTNADASETTEYCKFCFAKGAFTQPDQTLEEMIQSSIHFMQQELKFPAEQAEKMSRQFIPQLKRWQSSK